MKATLSTCASPSNLLDEIACTLKKKGAVLLGNRTLALSLPSPLYSLFLLSRYQRIVRARECNPDYLPDFTDEEIASRIKILKYQNQ